MHKMAKRQRYDMEDLMRSELMTKNRSPREVGDTDAYNEVQTCRIARTRHGPLATAPRGANKRRLRVLVVDDHRASADTLAMLVRIWGHNVRKAYDGAAALELAFKYRPDMILLDIMMPEISGRDLALRIRQQACLKKCLLIAITGCTDERQRLHCLEAGVDLFLIKPVTPHTLQSLLLAESNGRTGSRRAATPLAVARRAEQATGVRTSSPVRLGRDIATAAMAI
jgi:CheY-like chemotaxis protein